MTDKQVPADGEEPDRAAEYERARREAMGDLDQEDHPDNNQ
jgi:hypothetical protein